MQSFPHPCAPLTTNNYSFNFDRSDEIQSVVNAAKPGPAKHAPLKKNPLKNLGAMLKLNPYAKVRGVSCCCYRAVHVMWF